MAKRDNGLTVLPTRNPNLTICEIDENMPSWAIGYFINIMDGLSKKDYEFKYSIVPNHWLVMHQNNLMCKWPIGKSINVSKLIKESTPLTKDYFLYFFKLADNRYYDSLENANTKLLNMLNLSDSSDLEYKSDLEDGNKKKKQCLASDVNLDQNDVSLSIDSNDVRFSGPRQTMDCSDNNDISDDIFSPNTSMVSSMSSPSPTPPDNASSTENKTDIGLNNLISNQDSTLTVPLNISALVKLEEVSEESMENNLPPESSTGNVSILNSVPITSSTPKVQPNSVEFDGVQRELKDIRAELFVNRMMWARLWNRFDNLHEEIHNMIGNKIGYPTESQDEFFTNILPISSIENLNNFENMLRSDITGFQDKLIKMFRTIGGFDLKSHVRRILSRTFTNSFAIGCSWTGRGYRKNLSYVKIQGKLIIKIIQNFLRKQYNCPDSEFEQIVQGWFTHARTRFHKDQLDSST